MTGKLTDAAQRGWPDMAYQGHVFSIKGGEAVARCLYCDLSLALGEETPTIPGPCPGTEEGRRLIKEAEERALDITPGQPITEPCLAVPADWEGTEAEAIGLAIAGAVQHIVQERDAAKAKAAQLRGDRDDALGALELLVERTPEGTFAASNVALDNARATLARLAPKRPPSAGYDDQATPQT